MKQEKPFTGTVIEPERRTRIEGKFDVCVVGGSCTGAFAAIRAARLGARVALVERSNCMGGVATTGGVCVWHSLLDHEFEQQIIGGLTQEIIERLEKRRAVDIKEGGPHRGALKRIFRKSTIEVGRVDPTEKLSYRMDNILSYLLNNEELKIELDEMVLEAGVRLFLHTAYADPHVVDDQLQGIFIQNNDGRSLILANQFIDATGEGRICFDLGFESYMSDLLQPSTTLAKVYGLKNVDLDGLVQEHMEAYGLFDGGWSSYLPGMPEVLLIAKTRIFKDCSDATQFTEAEIEGRRQVRAIMDIARKYGKAEDSQLLSLSARIGIRESRRIRCMYQLTEEDVLTGRRFEDGIANLAYPVDVHHGDGKGVTQKYLDGYQEHIANQQRTVGRWRPEQDHYSTFYQIPFRSMIPKGSYRNILLCGRSVDADAGAFAAIRIMICANQQGEAAGVAAALAANGHYAASDADPSEVRKTLGKGGSIIL